MELKWYVHQRDGHKDTLKDTQRYTTFYKIATGGKRCWDIRAGRNVQKERENLSDLGDIQTGENQAERKAQSGRELGSFIPHDEVSYMPGPSWVKLGTQR